MHIPPAGTWVLQLLPGTCTAPDGMPKGWYCTSTATPFFTAKMVQEAKKYHVKGAAAVQGRQDAALIYQQLKTILKASSAQDQLC